MVCFVLNAGVDTKFIGQRKEYTQELNQVHFFKKKVLYRDHLEPNLFPDAWFRITLFYHEYKIWRAPLKIYKIRTH